MDKFETYRDNHGEHGVQALLENWEHHNGIKHDAPVTLEQRWDFFLRMTDTPRQAA